METQIKLYGVKWDVTTAGPSPDGNKRTEIFFFGCNRAVEGNPCKGCFNHELWDNSIVEFSHTPSSIVENIKLHASNKYVTIGGGEPTDQMDGLIELCELLKQEGFHVMIYTWKFAQNLPMRLLQTVDIIVDGEFKLDECLYDDSKGDGLMSSVGSGNQRIWDMKEQEAFSMKDLDAIALDDNNRLIYFLKNKDISPSKIRIPKPMRKGE